MTRWMLLALVACASAQDADRLQKATRALEDAAKATNSPLLSALAVKSATESGDSALTKVIKFIDEAYNTIQNQIEKETAANTRCVNLTNESNAKLDKLNRLQMQADADVASSTTDMENAAANAKEMAQQQDDNQNARSEMYNQFTEQKTTMEGHLGELQTNRQALASIQTTMATQHENLINKGDRMNDAQSEAMQKAVDLFKSLVARVQEQIDTQKSDIASAVRDYQDYVEEDDREDTRLSSGIQNQNSRRNNAAAEKTSSTERLNKSNKDLKTANALRADIDSQCVKTTVNHKDRAAQRQSEIDSLKQVKEILSQ